MESYREPKKQYRPQFKYCPQLSLLIIGVTDSKQQLSECDKGNKENKGNKGNNRNQPGKTNQHPSITLV